MKVVTIGRSSDNDVVINDWHASRRHLQIEQMDDGRYVLTDFGSTNGTFVNGRRVNGSVPLHGNDVVRIGNSVIAWQDYFSPIVVDPGGDDGEGGQKWWIYVGIGLAVAVVAVLIVLLVGGKGKGAPESDTIKEGDTYTYSTFVDYEYDMGEYLHIPFVSQFIFTTPTDVLWLMGTSVDELFPVGLGKYYKQGEREEVIFWSSNEVNKEIVFYYDRENVAFSFDSKKKRMALVPNSDDDEMMILFPDTTCMLEKGEPRLLQDKLVGTTWEPYLDEDGNRIDDDVIITFVDKTRGRIQRRELGYDMQYVPIVDEYHLYCLIDDRIAIKSDDNIRDENMGGKYSGGEKMKLGEYGLTTPMTDRMVTLRKKRNTK